MQHEGGAHSGSGDRLLEGQFSTEWAELDPSDVKLLLERTRVMPWREALESLRSVNQSFVARVSNLSLGDWSLLLRPRGGGRAVDIGCGFGALALGLASRFDQVTGVDILAARLAYASLRAQQCGATHVSFVQANGLQLPAAREAFDLAILNGVLEWTGLAGEGDPVALQEQLVREMRRVLHRDGVLAVAIENRFALETFAGMPDTHTGIRLLPVLPRWMARSVFRLQRGEALRCQLHSAGGYERLMRKAGFAKTRVLDLVPSYNDYDFVVDPADAASYRLLWRTRRVRSFNRLAGQLRATIGRVVPGVLGMLSYSYLVLAGESPTTVLDESHAIWQALAAQGVSPGSHRFGCSGRVRHSFAVVVHDGHRVSGVIELGPGLENFARDEESPTSIAGITLPKLRLAARLDLQGVPVRAYADASDAHGPRHRAVA